MHGAVTRFLAAVEARDVAAVLDCLTDDVTYRNVPHPPAVGREGVRGMLEPFLARCEQVRWDVVSSAKSGELSFVERVDRFWLDGREYSIECNGVYRVHDDRIAEVRDYVDLGVWHERLGDVAASPR